MTSPMPIENKDVCVNCHGSGKIVCDSCDGSGRNDLYGRSWLAFQLARQTCARKHGDAAKCEDCERVAAILIERSKAR